MSKGLWPCAIGTRNIDLDNPEDVEDDKQAQAIIMLHLDKTLFNHATKHKWMELDRLYGATVKNSKMSLRISLYGLEYKPKTEQLNAFISQMKGIMLHLALVQAPVANEDAISILLKAVIKIYPTLVTTLSNVPNPTFLDVI